MKKLTKIQKATQVFIPCIMLLFCFLPGWGQEEGGLDIQTGKETAKIWLRDTEKEYFCVMLLTAYEIYEKECDADSTWVTISCYKDSGDMLNHYDIVGRDLMKQVYYLKRRKDFNGFIKFLRKYGEGKKSK